jgi:hypothetical protein
MKWIVLFTFLINNIFFVNISYANTAVDLATGTPDKKEEKIQKDKQEAQELHSNLGISSIVPFDAFYKGLTGFNQTYKNRRGSKPYLSFVNYGIASNQKRMITVDLEKRSVLHSSHAAHGVNSSSDGGSGQCQKTSSVIAFGKNTPTCDIRGVPAVSFTNEGGSLQTLPLGFLLFTNKTTKAVRDKNGKVIGSEPAVAMAGLQGQDAVGRSILLHDSDYVESGGNSWGCIAVSNDMFKDMYDTLSGNTIVYTFSSGVDSSLTEEERNLIGSSSEPNTYNPAPASSSLPAKPKFEDLEISKAPASSGALIMGIVGIGAAYMLTSGKKKKSDDNPAMATEPLQGSTHYQECQKLSDTSWGETVKDINSGADPSSHFRGSWRELHQTARNNSVENGEAVEMAEERVATINDCVATAYISGRTDFTKSNINQPETKKSSDGSITCVYEGAESQDYQPCLDTIASYDTLRQNETVAHNKQVEDYKASSQSRVDLVKGENAQALALAQSSGLQADHSNVALERAEISSSNIDQLSAVASRIPTIDSLYDECKASYAKHGTVSVNEYNQFAKLYLGTPKSFAAERDYCLEAVTKAKPINNQNAREQVKAVLKKLGHEMQEYTSKSEALKNRSTMTPTMDSSAFTRNLTNLNLNGVDNGAPMGGYGRDGSMLMYNNGSGNNGAAGSFGAGGMINGQGSPGSAGAVGGINRRAPGMNGAGVYSTSGGYGSMGDAGSQNNNRTAGSGIYDEEFHRKINAALQSPEKVAELNLSPEDMKEYIARRDYNQLMAQGSANAGRAPASSAGDVKDERPVDISAKEMNIFDIISSRYAKEFSEDL